MLEPSAWRGEGQRLPRIAHFFFGFLAATVIFLSVVEIEPPPPPFACTNVDELSFLEEMIAQANRSSKLFEDTQQ